MGTHGKQEESWVPKARTPVMRRKAKKAIRKHGKDCRDKEEMEGKRRKALLSGPNAGDPDRSTVVEEGK